MGATSEEIPGHAFDSFEVRRAWLRSTGMWARNAQAVCECGQIETHRVYTLTAARAWHRKHTAAVLSGEAH